jgi:CheY-like chemotaxis protein/HPt (histidine-containing phosphotransfer) domain-containing protein
LIGLLLRRTGLTTVMVENGAQAVERAARERFDLILMDIQMPVLDGVSAMIKLKESGCDIPVIAVTANAMKEDQMRYRAAGFADFLVKPIDRSQLQRLLETYLPTAQTSNPPDSGPIYAKVFSAEDAEDEEVCRIMQTFIAKLPGYCDQLTQAIASRHWTQAREVAHQLRGLGGGMGYPIITELASSILFQLKTENYADVEHINARLGNVAERIQLGKSR